MLISIRGEEVLAAHSAEKAARRLRRHLTLLKLLLLGLPSQEKVFDLVFPQLELLLEVRKVVEKIWLLV
tara:strand:+ start:265 stop:471 length:207 start_codon:yes stop_codon:yes gene_type:complete